MYLYATAPWPDFSSPSGYPNAQNALKMPNPFPIIYSIAEAASAPCNTGLIFSLNSNLNS